jgi:biflaviolin synthase
VTIPEGGYLAILHQGANRDPSRWENPSEFNIFRESHSHSGFAFGPHACPGSNLARLESQMWLDKLLDRIPGYKLVSDEIDYGTNYVVRGPRSVLISL